MSTHRPEQPTPDYVPGHDLLAGKVVVVTAALFCPVVFTGTLGVLGGLVGAASLKVAVTVTDGVPVNQ